MPASALLAALLLSLLALPARAGEFAPLSPRDSLSRPADADSTLRADESAPSQPEAFPVVLGSFTTTLIGSRAARTANIRLAAEALDGHVIAPGEVLSFNAIVGDRSIARGYQSAPVILHEERQLQAGGGVCQVASTLFVAGLLSGLSSVERYRHSSPIDYIPLGEDATIVWGAKDLKLRNDLAQRVRLRVRVLGNTLSVAIDGEEPDAISYELATQERELPADPGVEGAQSGREIELYRVHRDKGATTVRELVHRDVYPPSLGRRSEH